MSVLYVLFVYIYIYIIICIYKFIYVEYETNHLSEDIVKLNYMMIILDLFTVDCISLVVDVETYYIFGVFKIHTVCHHITCNLRSFLGSLLPHHPYHPCPFWESLRPEFRAPLDHLFPDLSTERSFQSRGKNCSKSYQKNYPTRPHFQNNTPKQSLLSANERSFHPLGRVPYSHL